tara:strand:- start:5951 stop:7855 length:1905 start_codon:yes stop_codon:yes gene_type:complete
MLWSVPLIPLIAGALLAVSPPRSRLFLAWAAGLVLGFTLILVLLAISGGWTAELPWSDRIALTAALMPLSSAVAMMVPVIALPIVLHAAGHENARGLTRLIGLLLAFTGGMELVVVANDLLTVLIGWEVIGACSWALISHKWYESENPRSGLYAFVMTRFGDLGLFAAAMAAYAGTGSFAFHDLAALQGPYLGIVAFGLLISTASKAGQVPFSPWLFRAMAGPSSVSALLHAATLVAAGVYLLARLQPSLAAAPGFSATVIAVGLATALAGGVVALLQGHAKKLLAASTSAQLGFMFVAVGAGYPGIAVLHLIAHAAYKAPLFLSAGIAGDRAGSYRLEKMKFGRSLPLLAGLTAVAAIALAGLPPLGGGWTKEQIVTAAGHVDFWLAMAVILGGGLSAAYATRFQLLAYGRGEKADDTPRVGWKNILPIAVLAAMTLALSALWLTPVSEAAAPLIGAELPGGTTVEMVLSLLLLGLGVLTGVFLVRRFPGLGASRRTAAAANWLGLPSLIDNGITRPVDNLARGAAWLDDVALDFAPRTVAHAMRMGSSLVANIDNHVVDQGVRITAAFGEWLARIGDRFGEVIADGLPNGAAGLISMGGHELRRLQSGFSHHYLALLVVGLTAMIAILAARS